MRDHSGPDFMLYLGIGFEHHQAIGGNASHDKAL
jgi:hypothetical protein